MTAARPVSVRRIPAGLWEQNCYVVSSESGDAVVIDPGGEAAAIIERIAADGLRVHAVLATHGHYDHVGALAEVVDAYAVPFGAHAAERDVLRRVNFHRHMLHGLGPVGMREIGIDLEQTTALRFESLAIAVVHTPGHSPGGVCLEIGGELFTGDTLLATEAGRTDLHGADSAVLAASIAMLRERYPPATPLWPGHGEPSTLGAALAAMATAQEVSP